MRTQLIPRTASLLAAAYAAGIECLFARIARHARHARHADDGRDRSMSQQLPGWNNLLPPKRDLPGQLVAALQPQGDEIDLTNHRLGADRHQAAAELAQHGG
jgi:nicotinamidase-related amidase